MDLSCRGGYGGTEYSYQYITLSSQSRVMGCYTQKNESNCRRTVDFIKTWVYRIEHIGWLSHGCGVANLYILSIFLQHLGQMSDFEKSVCFQRTQMLFGRAIIGWLLRESGVDRGIVVWMVTVGGESMSRNEVVSTWHRVHELGEVEGLATSIALSLFMWMVYEESAVLSISWWEGYIERATS